LKEHGGAGFYDVTITEDKEVRRKQAGKGRPGAASGIAK